MLRADRRNALFFDLVSWLLGLICVLIIIAAFKQQAIAQEGANVTNRSSEAQRMIVVSNATAEQNKGNNVSYGEMLALYKEILETNKWTTTIFLAALTATGVGALYLYQRGVKGIGELQQRINEYKIEMEKSIKEYESVAALGAKLKEAINNHVSVVENIDRSLRDLTKKVKLIQTELKERIPRIETLARIDTYSIRLLSHSKKESLIARRTLVELSKDDDPVVRCKSILAFYLLATRGEIDDNSFESKQAIIERLSWLAKNDPEIGVKLEARHTLEAFGEPN